MSENRLEPTPYFHKVPMQYKDFEIHYNLDYSLSHIVPNTHNYYEFYFIISGDVTYYVETKEYHLLSGDIILISPNQKHYAYINTLDNQPYERFVLWLKPSYLDSLSSNNTNLSAIFKKTYLSSAQIRLNSESTIKIHKLLESIFIHSKSQRYGSDLLTNANVIELLVNLAQFKLFNPNSSPNYNLLSSSQSGNVLMTNVLNYINEYIYESICIQDICTHFFVSRSHLSKIFREEIGITMHQYIIKKKLFLARQDLVSGIPISLVVDKYSFGNYSSFFRVFKAEFGQSPKNYKPTKKLSSYSKNSDGSDS